MPRIYQKNEQLIEDLKICENLNLTNEETFTKLCSKYNKSKHAIRGYIYSYNIKLKSSCKKDVNDNFFNIIDSEIKAYLLGFFIADGFIVERTSKIKKTKNYRFGITLSEIDKYIINYYSKFICPSNKVRRDHNPKGAVDRKPTYGIQWTSEEMKDTMYNKYNIKALKTYDLDFKFPFETIPPDLVRHFIRGFFDGDGHISSKSKGNITFAIYGTSYKFLEQLGNIFENEFEVEKRIEGTIKHTMTLYCLRFKTKDLNRVKFFTNLYNYFYNNSEFFLERKKYKFQTFLNTVLI